MECACVRRERRRPAARRGECNAQPRVLRCGPGVQLGCAARCATAAGEAGSRHPEVYSPSLNCAAARLIDPSAPSIVTLRTPI